MNFPVFDLHCDTALALLGLGQSGENTCINTIARTKVVSTAKWDNRSSCSITYRE